MTAVDVDLNQRQPCWAAITQMQQEVHIFYLQERMWARLHVCRDETYQGLAENQCTIAGAMHAVQQGHAIAKAVQMTLTRRRGTQQFGFCKHAWNTQQPLPQQQTKKGYVKL